MTEQTRLVVGFALFIAFRVLIGGSFVYIVRRRRRFDPPWSWPWCVAAFLLLEIIVSIPALFGRIGEFVGGVMTYVCVKYMTGYGLVRAFFWLLFLLILTLAAAAAIDAALDIRLAELFGPVGRTSHDPPLGP